MLRGVGWLIEVQCRSPLLIYPCPENKRDPLTFFVFNIPLSIWLTYTVSINSKFQNPMPSFTPFCFNTLAYLHFLV
jgi:hypothetical protein